MSTPRKRDTARLRTMSYSRDAQGQWWIDWGGDFPGDQEGRARVSAEEQARLEIAHAAGRYDVGWCECHHGGGKP